MVISLSGRSTSKFYTINTRVRLRAGQRVLSIIRSFEWIGKIESISISFSNRMKRTSKEMKWYIDNIVVVDPQEKDTCLFQVNDYLVNYPRRYRRASLLREASWTYEKELTLNRISVVAFLSKVIFEWALKEPMVLIFLPSQNRLRRGEKVLIYAIAIFA